MVTSCFHTLFVLSERNVREDETAGHLSMFFRRVKEKRCRVVGNRNAARVETIVSVYENKCCRPY